MDDPVVPPQPNHTPVLLATVVSGLVFLTLGFLLGRSFSVRNPLDATLGPLPSFSPIPSPSVSWKPYRDTRFNYEVSIPNSWTIESGLRGDSGSFTIRQDDYDISLTIISTPFKTIQDFLAKEDKDSQTAWEGQPAIQVISTQKTTINNYNAVQRLEKPLAAGFAKPVIQTYFLNHGNVYIFSLRYLGNNPQTPDNMDYQAILSTFQFSN